jgi:hypothetical protein
VLWLEVYHCCDIVLQHLHSALDTESPPILFSFTKSGRQPHYNSIVSTLVYDSSLHFLGVQTIHLRDCKAGAYGLSGGSGDASLQSSNLIHQEDAMQSVTRSAIYLQYHDDALHLQNDCYMCDHFPIPLVCPK